MTSSRPSVFRSLLETRWGPWLCPRAPTTLFTPQPHTCFETRSGSSLWVSADFPKQEHLSWQKWHLNTPPPSSSPLQLGETPWWLLSGKPSVELMDTTSREKQGRTDGSLSGSPFPCSVNAKAMCWHLSDLWNKASTSTSLGHLAWVREKPLWY